LCGYSVKPHSWRHPKRISDLDERLDAVGIRREGLHPFLSLQHQLVCLLGGLPKDNELLKKGGDVVSRFNHHPKCDGPFDIALLLQNALEFGHLAGKP
jgi:hypothetical protein